MPVKLRLQRHGRKQRPFYHIVAADVRSPRDGKFIERVGWYDPTKAPALVDIDRDKALQWLMNGAQPTDSVRSILSRAGVLYRKHLMRGVRKGALNAEKAEELFEKWLEKRAKTKDKKMVVITPYRDIEPVLPAALQKITDAFYPKPQEEVIEVIDKPAPVAKKEEPKAPKVQKPRSERRPKKTVEEKIEEANTKVQEELAAKGKVIEPLGDSPLDTPAVEETPAPKVEAAPVVEAPKVEATPVVETPKAEAPKVETVGADTEAIDAIIDDSSSVLDEIDALLEKSSFNIDNLMDDAADKIEDESK